MKRKVTATTKTQSDNEIKQNIVRKVSERRASSSSSHVGQGGGHTPRRPAVRMMCGAWLGLTVRWAREGLKLHGQMVI